LAKTQVKGPRVTKKDKGLSEKSPLHPLPLCTIPGRGGGGPGGPNRRQLKRSPARLCWGKEEGVVGTNPRCSPRWKTDDDGRNRLGTLGGGRIESASGGGVPAARRHGLPAAARRGRARLPRPAGRCDGVWRARRLGVVRRRWALRRAAARLALGTRRRAQL
jgi:hypothetical protein